MAKGKTVKCRWKHCRHDRQDIPRDKAVQDDDGRYYHKDCLEEKRLVQKIKDVWKEKIDPEFNNMQLTVAINNLVYDHNYSLRYILFVVCEGAREGWLKYPNGLYQSVKDTERLNKWKKIIAREEVGDPQSSMDEVISPDVKVFQYNKTNRRSSAEKKISNWERMFA